MTAVASQMRHFGMVNALAQAALDGGKGSSVPADYRALVCIFLLGGNDGNNTVIPLHNDASLSNYSKYSALRSQQGLALGQNVALPFGVPRMGGLTYGFHPAFGVGATNNGLYEMPGFSATWIAAARASWFALPVTKLSNVKVRLRRARSR